MVLNNLDRYNPMMDVANPVPTLRPQAARIKQRMRDKLNSRPNILAPGADRPQVRDWKWSENKA